MTSDPIAPSKRSTADVQRRRVTAAAVSTFARMGYHATPVSEVATAAGVSPAYIFRLYPGKLGLFVAAVAHCYGRVRLAMIAGAEAAGTDAPPAAVLEAMTTAYVDLIRDRDLIMFQGHAQSACEVPEIRAAVQDGIAEVVTTVSTLSGAEAVEVQRFMAYGQLCHLILQAGLLPLDDPWARTLSAGIRHSPALPSGPAPD